MKLKYIIIDEISPIIFGETISHREASKAAYGKPITSAGFCAVETTPDGASVDVWGKSVSLDDLPSKPEDAQLIARLFA